MGVELYDRAQHRALAAPAWSEAAARAAIEAIAADAVAAYEGPDRLWPNAVDDLEGDPDVPYRNVYFGAAGVAWALDLLAREGLGPELAGVDGLADGLLAGFRQAPELVALAPAPAASLMFGESGILLAVESIRRDGGHLDQLEACIRRNARNPTLDTLLGLNDGRRAAAMARHRPGALAGAVA